MTWCITILFFSLLGLAMYYIRFPETRQVELVISDCEDRGGIRVH